MSADSEIEELFTIQQLADYIHKKPATIYSDLLRRPDSLPPVLRIPGSKKILFVSPRRWAAGLLAAQAEKPQSQVRRRGAPSMVERVRGRAGVAK